MADARRGTSHTESIAASGSQCVRGRVSASRMSQFRGIHEVHSKPRSCYLHWLYKDSTFGILDLPRGAEQEFPKTSLEPKM